MKGANRRLAVCRLGLSEYRPTWDLQRSLQSRLIRAKGLDESHGIPHVMLVVEHPPVYTLGKSGDVANLLIGGDRLSRIGATFERIDRGGDITFHGPGQLVAYPILDLGHFYSDIHRYLRDLEEVVMRTCAHYGLESLRVKGRTGVWVAPNGPPPRKICSMGIKSSRWVTCHGLALNVSTDLTYFSHIVPCGLADAEVTSLSKELGKPLSVDDVEPVFCEKFGEVFGVEMDHFSGEAADLFLEDYLLPRVNS